MKIVINKCFGGFSLSEEALKELNIKYSWEITRDDERLIKVVEKLGDRANGACAELKIVEIPDYVDWEIDEYDGLESVDEAHRSWN